MNKKAGLPPIIFAMILTAVLISPVMMVATDDSFADAPGTDCYYDCLSDDSKIVYDAIETAIDGDPLATEIPLASLGYTDGKASQQEARQAYRAFIWDHPELFWLSGRLECQYAGEVTTKIIPEYVVNDPADLTALRNTVDAAVNELLGGIDGEFAYDKVKQIHDAIVSSVSYDEDPATSGSWEAHSIYGPLHYGDGVCEGYAELFKVLCDKKGIDTMLVIGDGVSENGSEKHMWNYVAMDDGKWYCMDVTWDDPIGKKGNDIDYDFFLKGSESSYRGMTFAESHVLDDIISDLGFVIPTPSETQYRFQPGSESVTKLIETDENYYELVTADIPGYREEIGSKGTLVIQTDGFRFWFTCDELKKMHEALESESIPSISIMGLEGEKEIRAWNYDFLESIGDLYDKKVEVDAYGIMIITAGFDAMEPSDLGLESIMVGFEVELGPLDLDVFNTVWDVTDPENPVRIDAEYVDGYERARIANLGVFAAGNNPVSPALNDIPFVAIIAALVLAIVLIILLIRGIFRGRKVKKLAKKMSRSKKNMKHYKSLYDARELSSLERKAFVKAVKIYRKQNR